MTTNHGQCRCGRLATTKRTLIWTDGAERIRVCPQCAAEIDRVRAADVDAIRYGRRAA
jgi:ribosome-binding protein aMBF1 (putative translation factor)